MSSALGVTVNPEGETGTVTQLKSMPDQLPDNPATLAANTSIETINNIMYDNWIWRNSFTIDPTMRAGQVFGKIKIHPKNCNEYITHIAMMFLTWTGAFKIRSRFMATFQFGGSVRIGWLPPKFTDEQIDAMPITTLSAYPNIDLDPKNTDWTHFRASDERNVLFHWMSDLDSKDVSDHAGTFVFWIASPIMTSGPTNQISLLVEAAGDFHFSQLAPISNINPGIQGWLDSEAVSDILSQPGCDDHLCNDFQTLQIFPASMTSVPCGYVNAFGRGAYSNTLSSGSSMSAASTWLREQELAGNTPTHSYSGAIAVDLFSDGDRSHLYMIRGDEDKGLTLPLLGNAETKSYIFTAKTVPQTATQTFDVYSETKHFNSMFGVYAKSFEIPGANLSQSINTAWITSGWYSVLEHPSHPPPIVAEQLDYTNIPGSKLVNQAAGESIIGFCNLEYRTFNLQTESIARAMKAQATGPETMSQLYSLYADGTTGPLFNIRLQPNGMMTTNAVSTATLVTKKAATGPLRLRYVQDLPMSSPLPATAAMRYNLSMFGRATKKGYNAVKTKERVWYALQ